jgi:DnaJ-class molecular chaperone
MLDEVCCPPQNNALYTEHEDISGLFIAMEGRMPKAIPCPDCDGYGQVDCPTGHGLTGPAILYCPICRAQGIVTCPRCKGTKKIKVNQEKKSD